MEETARVERIRQQLPTTREWIYMNTGTAGPLPGPVIEAMDRQVQQELQIGRGNPLVMQRGPETTERVREAVARMISATPDEIALTHNTSEGLNIVFWGVNWQPGDEVISSSSEHPSGLMPLYSL